MAVGGAQGVPGRRGGKDRAGGGWEREAGEGREFREVRTAARLQEAAAAAPVVSLGKLVLGRGGGYWGLQGKASLRRPPGAPWVGLPAAFAAEAGAL